MVVTNPQPNEKNLVGVKSILKSVGRLMSYIIRALNLIGRLCKERANQKSEPTYYLISVADHFMFKIPGLGTILKLLRITPGTVESCAKDLREGNLLGIAPGGVYESQFSDHNYKVLWKSRVGFAKIALKAEAPVVPMFTRNVREAFRTIR